MNWEKMAGDDCARFCQKCQKSVTDLSQLTAREAEDSLAAQGSKDPACVRIWRDAEGQLITKGCPSSAAQAQSLAKKSVAVGVAVGVAATGLALAACSSPPEPEFACQLPHPEGSRPVLMEGVTVMMGTPCLLPDPE